MPGKNVPPSSPAQALGRIESSLFSTCRSPPHLIPFLFLSNPNLKEILLRCGTYLL